MLVMEMSRKEQQIPAIRFNGFTDAWEQRKLGKVLHERKMRKKISEETPLLAFAAGQGVIDRSERKTNNRDFLTKDSSTKTYLFTKYDDIVYNPSNLKYGAIDRNKHGQGVISPIYVTFETEEISSFIELIVRGDSFKQRALQYEEGTVTKRQSVKPESLLSLNIALPISKKEQQKIGDFFKQLDDTIALHQRQVNNYKLLKNSLIQQMFPQGGEQLPKMRFAGFSGEWVRKKLGEFVEINRGLTYKPEDVVSDGIRVLRSSNIKQDIFELRADDVFVRHDAANIPEIKNGDILVTSANGSTALVGKHAIVDKLPSKTVHGGFMLVIRYEHNYFINTWMSSSEYKRVLQLVQGGNGAIGNLSKKVLEEAVIAIPSDEEQTKIGNFFKKLDDNITFHQQKTDDYQQLKKVLLQQMFL